MIRLILLLLGCLLVGETLSRGFDWLVPGNVVGMALLFLWLCWRGRVPEGMETRVRSFLAPLPLYFVPASVGLMTFSGLLSWEGAAVLITMVLSTAITVGVVGRVSDFWLLRRG